MDQKKIHEKGKIIMNKHFKTFLLVIGGALLVSGSALFAAGCKNVAIKAKTREFDFTGQQLKSLILIVTHLILSLLQQQIPQ